MKPPTNVTDLRRFMGMVNQLGKFSKELADLTQPLRQLLSKKATWLWSMEQDKAFARVKEELTRPTILAAYDPQAPTKVSADASSYGLGAVLLQKKASVWKPVAFASRAMSETEQRYAQIEKEALASTWACEKFATYILGMKFLLETDHKPLVPLLGGKHLDSLPPRILRFRLRLARFDYTITHVPGKYLYTADMLSRSPSNAVASDWNLEEEAEAIMQVHVAHLPASSKNLDRYRTAQAEDRICSRIIKLCCEGWPDKRNLEADLQPFWKARGKLTLDQNALLLYGKRIVIPKALQKETLGKIHEGHQGIQRCRLRASISVWWPGLTHEVQNMVKQCQKCCREFTPRKEPMIPTSLPDYPWQRIGMDLFYLKGDTYLLAIDYFSRYPEIQKLTGTTSSSIIEALKNNFSRHGVPEVVVSDNGPQYSSQEFADFAEEYAFEHVTSSPLYAQSNGQAERSIQTIKKLLKESRDPHMALLVYRSTPFPWCDLSPAELLMGRRLQANVPISNSQLIPVWGYLKDFRRENNDFKTRQMMAYDRCHGVRDLSPLPNDTEVWVTSGKEPTRGRVTAPADTPRSYRVETPTGPICRNRQHLNPIPGEQSTGEQEQSPQPNIIMTRSRTGTIIRPPDRLNISDF